MLFLMLFSIRNEFEQYCPFIQSIIRTTPSTISWYVPTSTEVRVSWCARMILIRNSFISNGCIFSQNCTLRSIRSISFLSPAASVLPILHASNGPDCFNNHPQVLFHVVNAIIQHWRIRFLNFMYFSIDWLKWSDGIWTLKEPFHHLNFLLLTQKLLQKRYNPKIKHNGHL